MDTLKSGTDTLSQSAPSLVSGVNSLSDGINTAGLSFNDPDVQMKKLQSIKLQKQGRCKTGR